MTSTSTSEHEHCLAPGCGRRLWPKRHRRVFHFCPVLGPSMQTFQPETSYFAQKPLHVFNG